MKCSEIQTLIFDYVEGRLSRELEHQVAAHVNNCPRCTTAMREWQELYGLITDTAAPTLSLSLVERTVARSREAYEAQHDNHQAARGGWRGLLWNETARNLAASFAATLVLLVMGEAVLATPSGTISALTDDPTVVGMTGSTFTGLFALLARYVDHVFGLVLHWSSMIGSSF